MTKEEFINQGEEYLKLGFSIIPVGEDKKPLIKWEQFQQRKASKKEVEQWASSFSNLNIGIITGSISGIVVVDVEAGGPTDNLPTTVISRTGGGGFHFYYKYPDVEVKNAVRIRDKTDIRGDGGYVIAPPSLHKSGKNYVWVISPDKSDFAELPKWVLNTELLPKPKTDWQQLSSSINPEGSRNDTAAKLAGKLLHHLPQDLWELAWGAVKEYNLTQNDPPLSETELRHTFESIVAKESTNPLRPIRDRDAMQWLEPVPIESLSSEDTMKLDWIWEGFLAKGHLTLLPAYWKSGKTTLISWLLASIQSQTSLANKVTKPCNVLVISEESRHIWNNRKESFSLSNGIWLSCKPTKHKLNSHEWEQFLDNWSKFCSENKIDLVIIDTLTTFWPVKDENHSVDVTEAILPINYLLEKNISVLLVHHLKKGDGAEATGSRGSGALPSLVDIIVEFRRFNASKDEDTRRVLKCYSRFDETPTNVVIELTKDGYITQGSTQEVTQNDKLNILRQILPAEPNGITINELVNKWPSGFGDPPERTTIFRWLKILQDKYQQAKVIGKSSEQGTPDLWTTPAPLALQPPPYIDAINKQKANGNLTQLSSLPGLEGYSE